LQHKEACNCAYGRRSLGFSNGIRSLSWLNTAEVGERVDMTSLRHADDFRMLAVAPPTY